MRYLPALLFVAVSHAAAQTPTQAATTTSTATPTPLQSALQLLGAGNHDSARVMFESVVAQRLPGAPRALQELIALYARAGRFDDAHAALEGARAARVDFSLIAARTDIAPLRSDGRFAILFPDSATMTRPFVENTRIIHEWRGEKRGDEFGWIARPIGDVDDDGVTDVVVSATMSPPHGNGQGKLFVYSGRSGRLIWSRAGEDGWRLGVSAESAGDVNADGVPDIVGGAPGASAVLVLSGRDGQEIHRVHGDSVEAMFGGAVAGIGDINNDGFHDFVVGASGTSVRARGAGRVIVYSGRDKSRLHVFDGVQAGSAFGAAVAGAAGRFIAVGAPGAGPAQRGRVFLFDGLDSTPRFTFDADSTGVALGAMFVSMSGDVDGDKLSDVFATDFVNSAKGPATGRAYVFSSVSGKVLLTLTGEAGGDTFGTSASYAGDVNGDAIADFAVGSWQYGGSAWSGGRITVHSGKDGAVLQRMTGRIPGETLGFDSVGVGDVDGDGVPDYLVTSAYSLVNGARSGRAYIVAGSAR